MDNSRSPKYVLRYKSKGNRDMGRPKDKFSLILGNRSCYNLQLLYSDKLPQLQFYWRDAADIAPRHFNLTFADVKFPVIVGLLWNPIYLLLLSELDHCCRLTLIELEENVTRTTGYKHEVLERTTEAFFAPSGSVSTVVIGLQGLLIKFGFPSVWTKSTNNIKDWACVKFASVDIILSSVDMFVSLIHT